MGCFVRGGKSVWDVLSRVAKNGMGCFVPRCFVRLPYRVIEFNFKSRKGYEQLINVLFSTLFIYIKNTQNNLHKAMFLQDIYEHKSI